VPVNRIGDLPLDIELIHSAKKQLRRRLQSLRTALPAERVRARSERIVERLLRHPFVVQSTGVALFWPMLERREVDLRAVDTALRERGTRLCYPFMERESDGSCITGFRWVTETAQLVERGQRFAEPPLDAPIAKRGEVDLVVVPALAVTAEGHRLGYGAGFYDATLPDLCPPAKTIIVAFDFQLLMELPLTEQDVRCDAVITDA
jgi:5-formyltetrahydrofolate cyclo-ligase